MSSFKLFDFLGHLQLGGNKFLVKKHYCILLINHLIHITPFRLKNESFF